MTIISEQSPYFLQQRRENNENKMNYYCLSYLGCSDCCSNRWACNE